MLRLIIKLGALHHVYLSDQHLTGWLGIWFIGKVSAGETGSNYSSAIL